MKIKNLVNHCKREGVVHMYMDEDGFQWLGDGCSMYPLFDMPLFTETSFCAAFDIDKHKRDQMSIQFFQSCPAHLDTRDVCDDEQEVFAAKSLAIEVNRQRYIPYATKLGVRFLSDAYLRPLLDVKNGLQMYERYTTEGNMYFAAKSGLELKAIILPSQIVTEDLVDQLSVLAQQCKTALSNMQGGDWNDGI